MTSQIEPLLRDLLQSEEEEATHEFVVRAFPHPVPEAEEPTTAPEPVRPVWEYRTVLGGAGAKQAAERLNHLGAEGWELVAVEPPPAGGQTVLYLKRQKLD